jgi:hypothetical protein
MPIEKDTIIFWTESTFIQLASQSNLLKKQSHAYDQLASVDLKKGIIKNIFQNMSSHLGLYSFNSALENITNHGESTITKKCLK